MIRQAHSALDKVRVLHLTDPHLFADPDGELRGVVTLESFRKVLDHYAAGDWVADLVVATGDIVQDDSRRAYEYFRDVIAELGLPVYCVPGNHDVREQMRSVLDGGPFQYCGHTEIANWLIFGLDSCLDGRAGGAVSAAELERLATTIEASDAEHVMVCLHHPPVEMHSRWLDSVGLENRDEIVAALNAADRVKLTIFGHVHQEYDARHGRVRIVGTPSTCRQFRPGSDKFDVDDRPPAYRRITLATDGSFDHELVWVDDA